MSLRSFCTQFEVLLYNSQNLISVLCLHTICSIWPIDMTLSGATTLVQSGPGGNTNEGLLHIPKSSKAGDSSSGCLVWYPRHSLWGVGITPAEMQSVYSAALAEWAETIHGWLVGWLFGFYGISTFVGYLTPKPFLC